MYGPAASDLKRYIMEDITLAEITLSEIQKRYRQIGMTTGKKVLPAFLSSNFLSEDQYEKIKVQSESFTGILNKIALHYCIGDDPKTFSEIVGPDSGFFKDMPRCDPFNILNRLDMFFDGKVLKLIEFNCESPSGIGRMALIDRIFFDTPQLKRFRKRITRPKDILQKLLNAFVRRYKDCGGKKEKPSIAFVDWRDVSTSADQGFIIEYFNSKGYPAFRCDPACLRYAEGRLFHDKTQIDIVFKRVMAKELFSRREECIDFIEALKEGKTCVINPCISIILNDKRLLHYLSNGTFDVLLDEEEIKIKRDMIPWTREVKDRMVTGPTGRKTGMIGYIAENKDSLVLKPGRGYGGSQVVIGNQASEKVWKAALNTALAEQDWIVQEYIDIPTIEVFEKKGFTRKYINLSPFMIDGKLAGFFTRVSESKIININKGGGLIPTFVVKG